MKRITTLLSFSALLAAPFTGFSQEDVKHCGSAERMRQLYAKNPQLEHDQEEFLRNCMTYKSGTRDSAMPIITIPLVFHVIHQYGAENITDAQIFSEVNNLNTNYMKMNADTATVVPAFDSLIGKAYIQFKLANFDPQGNCTNGIVRYYSHESTQGDDYSKLDQWPRSRYLNVWVVKTMENGVAGYAYYPSSVPNLPLAAADGVIILQDYIGSIGTSSPYTSKALTHEIGHYLSLPHTWGSTNNPGIACGDDGIADTPVTKGHLNCTAAALNDQTCTAGVVENTQNYMEYSYCSVMFTPDQVTAMRMALSSNISNRNNLWTDENHTFTGTDLASPVLCTPMPDMYPSKKYVCMGDNVTFTSVSWRANVSNYSWSFPGAMPATSTAANPTVTYNTFGWHDVTLTVTNAAGSETKTFTQSVMVSNPWTEFVGPYSEGFEGTSSNWWLTDNPENNEAGWSRVNFGAATGSYCYRLNNHKDVDMFSYIYFNQLGGNVDALISPSYDLSHTTSASLSFKYSCATHAYTLADQTEQLQVWSSIDCGKTWTPRGGAIDGAELATAGTVSGDYVPTSGALWATKTIALPTSVLKPNVRFKFAYTASDNSNNIYLDDININGILGVADEVAAEAFDLVVYPNPASAEAGVNVSFMTNEKPTTVMVSDIVGQTVYTATVPAGSGKVNHFISTNQLSKGIYTVNLTNGQYKQTVKVVIQ